MGFLLTDVLNPDWVASFFTHLICNSVCEARPHIKVLVDSTRKRHAVSSAWKLPMSCTHQSLNPVFSWIDWHSGSYTLANPEKNCEVSGCETDISQPYNYPQSPLWVTLIGEAIEIKPYLEVVSVKSVFTLTLTRVVPRPSSSKRDLELRVSWIRGCWILTSLRLRL